jgi:hypothetical protein
VPVRASGLFTRVLEDVEDLLYQRFALLGRKVPRVYGLLVGLQVAVIRLFGQVSVYEAHDGVDLLARETVAATG